jgi:hypothetical protein
MLALAAAVVSAVAAFTAPAPVRALALDAPLLAYATGRSAGDCDRVSIRNLDTARVVRLGRTTSCEQTSTGTGIASVSIAGNRVLWLHFAGGNIREWSLYTATTTATRPRRLRFVARDVDAAPPIVLGEGDTSRFGDLLPYAVDRQLIVLHPNGSRAFVWTAPDRVTAVGANAGAVAVAVADGRVFVLEGGRVSSSFAGAPAATAVFVTGDGVAVQRGRTIELRSGSTVRWSVPADARLRDAEGSRLVYTAGGRTWLREPGAAQARSLGAGSDAQLEATTLALASGRSIRLLRISYYY